ncbi:MAG: thioredoxin domain-containing protein [Bacteroidota bacterium]
MKFRRLLLPLFVLALLGTCARAQGIEFFHGSWEEALAKATAEDKLIFVDAYASWCGPCKRMAANVFPQKEVGDYFNANFINVKLDMEKAESTEFRKNHSVRAFPTLFFINGENEEVHKTVGGKQAKGLLSVANAAIAKMDDLDALTAAWEGGKRNSAFAYKYIRALVRNNEPHAKVTNDYLRTQQDLTTPDNLNILLTAATAADSRIFDLLLDNRDAAVALTGQETVDAQVTRAIMATKDKAVEYKDEALLKTAIKKLATVDKDKSKQLALAGAFELAAAGNDLKTFQKATKKYLAKGAGNDAAQLASIYKITASSKFIDDAQVLDLAIDAGSRAAAADADNAYRRYYKLADFLLKRGKTDAALKYAQLSLDSIPGKQPNYERAIKGLIQRIENAR